MHVEEAHEKEKTPTGSEPEGVHTGKSEMDKRRSNEGADSKSPEDVSGNVTDSEDDVKPAKITQVVSPIPSPKDGVHTSAKSPNSRGGERVNLGRKRRRR